MEGRLDVSGLHIWPLLPVTREARGLSACKLPSANICPMHGPWMTPLCEAPHLGLRPHPGAASAGVTLSLQLLPSFLPPSVQTPVLSASELGTGVQGGDGALSSKELTVQGVR